MKEDDFSPGVWYHLTLHCDKEYVLRFMKDKKYGKVFMNVEGTKYYAGKVYSKIKKSFVTGYPDGL